jgi:hypothetical protein
VAIDHDFLVRLRIDHAIKLSQPKILSTQYSNLSGQRFESRDMRVRRHLERGDSFLQLSGKFPGTTGFGDKSVTNDEHGLASCRGYSDPLKRHNTSPMLVFVRNEM